MIDNYNLEIDRNKRITINDLLIWCFAIWPLFWNLWGVLRFPTDTFGASTSIYILWGITFLIILFNHRISSSKLLIWFVFLVVAIIEIILSHSYGGLLNISVIICGFLPCVFFHDKYINYNLILKCLYICGLFICVTVLIEYITHVFSIELINIYTDSTQKTIARFSQNGGGILPHSASAGCFIYSGLVSYIMLLRVGRIKKNRLLNWIITIVFVICMVIIRKRGMILDVLVATLLLWLFGIKRNDLKKVNLKRQLRVVGLLIVVLIAAIVIYYTIPLVRESIDSIMNKFYQDDYTSGRTGLYELAFVLVRRNIWTGIGWGRFRSYTIGFFGLEDVSYAAHNVYIQLLCETGIIGLTVFIIVVVVTLWYGISKYRKTLNEENLYEKSIIGSGLFIQFFFLAYCVTGNPLYDYNFLVTYFIGVLLTTVPVLSNQKG